MSNIREPLLSPHPDKYCYGAGLTLLVIFIFALVARGSFRTVEE